MTIDANTGYWVNYENAMKAVRAFCDKGLQQFVMRGVTAATVRCMQGEPPTAPFDLVFFVQTMAALYEQRANLIRVLSGEDLGWWPDEVEK